MENGYARPCSDCRIQPQAIADLCLGCNSALGRSAETRLKELDLQDPSAVSGTFQTQPRNNVSLTTFLVIQYFNREWDSARVAKVYEIRLPRNIQKTREAYKYDLFAPPLRKTDGIQLTCPIFQRNFERIWKATPTKNVPQHPVYLRPWYTRRTILLLGLVWHMCSHQERI